MSGGFQVFFIIVIVDNEGDLSSVPQTDRDSSHVGFGHRDISLTVNLGSFPYWSSGSDGFLKSFKFDGFNEFYNGVSLGKGRRGRVMVGQEGMDGFGKDCDGEERKKLEGLSFGFGLKEKGLLFSELREEGMLCFTKYKPVAKNVKPVNFAMPQDINPPLMRPGLSRDPYINPLTHFPLIFVVLLKLLLRDV